MDDQVRPVFIRDGSFSQFFGTDQDDCHAEAGFPGASDVPLEVITDIGAARRDHSGVLGSDVINGWVWFADAKH